jgi:hypothetical protein
MVTMRKLLLVIAAAASLRAQTTTVTLSGPGTITPGNSLNATLSIAGSAGQAIVALQWSLVLPAGFTVGAPTMASSEPSGDTAQCGTAACLIYGSLTSVVDGTLATIPISVSATAALGTQSLNVSSLFASTAAGFNVNGLVSGAPYSLKVLSRCDLNGDGTVNIADIQLIVNAVLNASACPISAASGGCTILTVVTEESVAAGVTACKL